MNKLIPQYCPRCVIIKMEVEPDHLECPNCKFKKPLPEDELMRRADAPTLPGFD